ncbi:MAG: PaaI family thioesterase [Pseudomonadota bacterium]
MIVPEELKKGFYRIPVNRHLKFELVSRSPEEAVVSMEVLPEFIQETGVLHGGLIGTLADTAAVHLFEPDLPEGKTISCIEFKINFLSPAVQGGGSVVARSRLIRRGNRVGVADVLVVQEDRLVAKGTFTYLFFPRKA